MKDNLKIVATNDGSHTLYRKDLDEHYHSIYGAIQESLHVFIEAGLKTYIIRHQVANINILEIGLGTGLNALLTLNENKNLNKSLNYHALEPLPIPSHIYNKINYQTTDNTYFNKIHESEWGIDCLICKDFVLNKISEKLENYNSALKFDLVYYDAFGPNSQKEMWDIQQFHKLFKLLNRNGILVTYCAKGQVRRDLESVGFKVERLPGPKGKREMLRANKI